MAAMTVSEAKEQIAFRLEYPLNNPREQQEDLERLLRILYDAFDDRVKQIYAEEFRMLVRSVNGKDLVTLCQCASCVHLRAAHNVEGGERV